MPKENKTERGKTAVRPRNWLAWIAIVAGLAGIAMLILFKYQIVPQPATMLPSEFQAKLDADPCQIAQATLNYNPQSETLGEVEGAYYLVDEKGQILKDKEPVKFRTQVLLSEVVKNKLQTVPGFKIEQQNTMWMSILVTLLPFGLIAAGVAFCALIFLILFRLAKKPQT